MKIIRDDYAQYDVIVVDFIPIEESIVYPLNQKLAELVEWCEDQFGPIGELGAPFTGHAWKVITNTFYFENPEHSTMFLLRWSTES